MRYSMLVYIVKMSRTLLEAVQYLRTASEGDLRVELMGNGRQMLAQMREVLEQHRGDLRSTTPLERLDRVETLWESCGDGLEELLEQVIQELPEQVSYQVRAVFFAELGEKWDAMESVYEYMRDDPRFDPVVVRTPVGRVVNRDGKREQEVIYKDFLTPIGIPSLGYDQYDIEQDCPELAFISQPYESCTLEQFWPENIAKYTRLVYLPYFLPFLILEDHKQTLCQLPVYRCAWRVLGASDCHLHFYSKYALNGGGNMMVTGLPKLDPVIRLREQAITLPEPWIQAVKARKVFLWNTWYDYLSSSLIHFKTMLEWFQSHMDCALIWRPHPMTDTVTKLYYSAETYARLQQCIADIKKLPNAVLDQEPSCNAAFSCSDAQISDYSSLMGQYLLLDKPLLWTRNTRLDGNFACGSQSYFIDPAWMEEASQPDEILQFLERIRNGEDQKASVRKEILRRDIPLADGRCGERVCENVLKAIREDDFN